MENSLATNPSLQFQRQVSLHLQTFDTTNISPPHGGRSRLLLLDLSTQYAGIREEQTPQICTSMRRILSSEP